MWQTRKYKLSKDYPYLLCLQLLLCILLVDITKCDDNLILNYCCPENSEYDLINDKCLEIPNTSTKAETADPANLLSANNNGSKPVRPNYLTLPSRLVLDLSRRNQTEYEFRTHGNPTTNTCKKGKFMLVLNLLEDTDEEITGTKNLQSNHTTGSPPLPKTSIRFTSKGQLGFKKEYYSPPEFCIARFETERLTIRVCNATCSEETPCIRKCCDLNEVWNLKRKAPGATQGCVPAIKNIWEPEFYKYPKVKFTPEERRVIHPHYKIIHPREYCFTFPPPRNIHSIEQREESGRTYWKYRVNSTGQIFLRKSRYTWRKDDVPETYCLDGAINSEYLVGEDQTEYSGLKEDDFMLMCTPRSALPSRDQSALYAGLMIISCFFLLLTIVVHIAIYDKQPNRAWTLTLISYTISLFFFYMVFAMMHISGFYITRGKKLNSVCYSIAVGVNFFFVSTFCWMSAVNYDIFTTFKSLKPTSGRSKGIRKYLFYAAFSLTVPTVIVTIGLVIDNVYGYDYESGIVVPEYGHRKCNLDEEYAQLAYTYGPAGVLLIFNVICFIITIYTMYQIQKSTKFATASSSKKRQQEQSFKLFAKLIFVMGSPWIFEIISWYVEKDKAAANSWYWLVTDFINIFQAVAIFWIFVCKPDVIRLLEQKYPWFSRFLDSVLLDSASAQKITDKHPKLKRLVGALTRKARADSGGSVGAKSGRTESTGVSSSIPSNAEVEMSSVESPQKI